MNANELRIGNLVKSEISKGLFGTIVSTTQDPNRVIVDFNGQVEPCLLSNLNPITLTEEWLVKTEANHENGGFHFEHFTIRKNKFTSEWDVFFSDDGNQIAIKFLHELQNLFFAFHKKELKLT